MKLGLTARQHELLIFIKRYFNEKRHAPSISEMAAGINSPSRGSTHRLVECLIERGYVKRLANRTRSIALVLDDDEPSIVPDDVVVRLKPYCHATSTSLDDALRLAVSRFFGGAA